MVQTWWRRTNKHSVLIMPRKNKATPSIAPVVIDPLDSQIIYAGAVRSLAVDPRSPSIVYASTRAGDVFKTTNGGESWTPINNGLRVAGIESVVLDPKNPDIIYAGTTADGVYVSFDAGASWSRE
jgi:hypothetical protein